MDKAYTRIVWYNSPSVASPLNENNLNKMDVAINTIDDRVVAMDTQKANQSDLLSVLRSVGYNEQTGVFLFTYMNGNTMEVDLNIEKIPVSFSMSPQGVITMVNSDGTSYTADVSSLIKTYSFSNSNRIHFNVTIDSNGNKNITADLVQGSITGNYLQPDYLADITVQATNASAAATSAATSANETASSAQEASDYADDAKDYSDAARGYAEDAEQSASDASSYATTAGTHATAAATSETNAQTYANDAATSATRATMAADDIQDDVEYIEEHLHDVDEAVASATQSAQTATSMASTAVTKASEAAASAASAEQSAEDAERYAHMVANVPDELQFDPNTNTLSMLSKDTLVDSVVISGTSVIADDSDEGMVFS